MTDVHTKEQRSKNMAAIKSRNNQTTEVAAISLFKKFGIKGWRRQYRKLIGTPDFVFPESKLALFIDGCFWHGCPKCYTSPLTNKEFWNKKIKDNKNRDQMVSKKLRSKGWQVLRIWEHELKSNGDSIANKIKKKLKRITDTE